MICEHVKYCSLCDVVLPSMEMATNFTINVLKYRLVVYHALISN